MRSTTLVSALVKWQVCEHGPSVLGLGLAEQQSCFHLVSDALFEIWWLLLGATSCTLCPDPCDFCKSLVPEAFLKCETSWHGW